MANGSISENDLMRKLVNAKKVMNKVDGGDYQKGNIDQETLFSDPSQLMESNLPKQPNTRPVGGNVNVDKIQNSKLPDAIKQAMINHPIEQMQSISLNETLDMDFVKGAKKLMEKEGLAKKPETKSFSSHSMDMNTIAVLIENTVRKVMDEKLNQILSASTTQSINENLVLKVGDSIFKGKITGVNKSK